MTVTTNYADMAAIVESRAISLLKRIQEFDEFKIPTDINSVTISNIDILLKLETNQQTRNYITHL